MYKISIIDHVGIKAGMDYYSSSLAKGFINQKCTCSIYSNFIGIDADKIDYKQYFEGHSEKTALFKIFRFVAATVESSIDARKRKTDLVILHLFSANIITLFLIMIPNIFGLKTAIISHDISSLIDADSPFIQSLIYNTFSDHIIVHNQFSHDELINNVKLNDLKKIAIIKHGGYLDHINVRSDKASIREAIGLEAGGKYILFFGQIKEVKGLDVLLNAMCKVTLDIKLIIAGKPWKSDFIRYDALIRKYNLENRIVKMIRFIEDDERENLFFAADVNVLPYRTIYQSGVLLMAMSYGLPVISSDLPANREIIEDGVNGMLFNNMDADDLAKQINSFFEDYSLRKRISRNALNAIEKAYGWNDIAKKYLGLL